MPALLILLVAHLIAGARRARKRRGQQRHGGRQDRRHPDFRVSARRAPVNTANWHPFVPNGFPGSAHRRAIVFFTYIGFDSVSTAAEECRNPQRDLPFGIIMTLVVCAVLYISVALVLTGIAPLARRSTRDAPVADALKPWATTGCAWCERRRLVGMISSLLVFQYGQARIWFAMSRDRLLPGMFSKVHPSAIRRRYISTWIAGLVVGIPAGIWDIGTFAELANIGTLFAFVLVSLGVIVLREKQPERPRSFRVPLVPLFPMISIGCCVVLMVGLPLLTWLRFFVWLAIGLAILLPLRPQAQRAGGEKVTFRCPFRAGVYVWLSRRTGPQRGMLCRSKVWTNALVESSIGASKPRSIDRRHRILHLRTLPRSLTSLRIGSLSRFHRRARAATLRALQPPLGLHDVCQDVVHARQVSRPFRLQPFQYVVADAQ